MLVRLECKICDVDPDLSPRQEYSTIHWKGMIVKNPNDIRLPDINVKGQLQSYYFLLNGCSKTECTAYLLHSADQLNGGIIHRLASYENTLRKSDPGSKVNPHELLEDLPLFDVGDLWKMENDLMNLQSVALKNWIEKKDIQEKKCQISQNEIVELLTKVRSDYIDQFTTDRTCKLQLIKTMELEAMNLCSELDYNTGSDWIEKKALINKEALHKKFKRVKTEEMIFRGEVIRVPEAGTSVRLDVSEFLKYFKNSGKPVSDQSSPTNCVHSETCKPCTFSDPTTLSCASFKDAVQMHHHGIDYCLDSRNAEKINDRRLRIQARYITHETSSTCTLEQVASAATMLVPSPAAQASPQEASIEKEPRRTKSLTSSSHTIKTRNSTAKEELLQKRSVRSSPRRASMPRIKAIKQQDSKRSSSLSHQRSASVGSAQSRSNKHKQALRYTVDKTLKKHGIDKDHASYAQCVTRLYSLCKSFLKDLTSSHGLEQEMKAVAESNVAQVISFELRRSRKR
uniref:Mdm2-binding protein-like n=1 Tax=Saccoglossus kowalevskii TaxID=10224 RepID=A0ABM0M446_SACKO|nr:PREDICTED: mdm2-binding protein-like [Saccoglossus kowalevskii]